MLRPKLFDTIKTYTLRQFYADAMAGTIVGIVALPLAIAFAIASGVSPERGLFTAVIGGLVISLLGGILASACLMSLLHIETPTSHELIDMWGALSVLSFGALSGVVGFVFGAGVGQPSDRRRD